MYLTQELPGIGGRLKERPEDFVVDEVARFEPEGSGPYLTLRLEKQGLSTPRALAAVARWLGLSPAQVGIAGIKDARAVTRQWITVPAGCEPRLASRSPPAGLRVLEQARCKKKLRPGELDGNRFDVLVREPHPQAGARARAILQHLSAAGVPNAFGPQRFGVKGDTDRIGAALLHADFDGALHWFLGAPSPREGDARIREARERFDAGRAAEALPCWPREMREERRVLEAYLRKESADAAVRRLSRSLRFLFLSAVQSRLFNRCLERRLPGIGELLPGDVVHDHTFESACPVLDLEEDRRRARAFELSPAGPLFGPGLLRARGEAAALEEEVFAAAGIDLECDAAPFRDVHLRGERRPYRVRLTAFEMVPDPAGLRLRFFLPAGSYATVLLAEVMKPEEPEALLGPAGGEDPSPDLDSASA